MARIPSPARWILAAAVAVIAAVIAVILVSTGGDDTASVGIAPTATRSTTATASPDGGEAATMTLDLFLSEAVADRVDVAALHERIAQTLGAAVQADVVIEPLAGAPSDRLTAALDALAAQTGYAAARARLDDLQAREPATIEEQDQISNAALEATNAVAVAEDALEELRRANSPLVPVSDGSATVQITAARQYGAERPEGERWALVRAGVALELYQDDPATLYQSIANQVVRAVGLLAGLEPRSGTPSDAMVDNVDFDAGEELQRDAAGVTFIDDERQTVRDRFVRAAN